MERQTDNNVYVLALALSPMLTGQTHTWIDVVEKDQRYFHPVGNHWPVQPPNYIGFRYRGCLQSVHHIDSFEIVEGRYRAASRRGRPSWNREQIRPHPKAAPPGRWERNR